jgi:UDP-N-acetyl-2-amino-2-deoxyglucuronate dehydrogenase
MTLHVGLIGGGNITETHARAARATPGVEVAAMYGENADKVARLCRKHGGRPYTDFDRFLAHRPMDLVLIGSPSGLHAGQGIKAAQQGLHVLTEKPLDITTEACDAFIAQAEKSGVKLGVFFQDRSKPDVRRLQALVESGRLGKLTFADAQVKWYRPPEYYGDSRWRGVLALDGGGALMSQGIHTLDLLLWLLGDVVAVQSQMKTALHTMQSEDTLAAVLEFANGAIGVFTATTSVYPGYPRRVELSFAEGTIVFEHDRISRADLRVAIPDLVQNQEADSNVSASSPVISDIRGHQWMLGDFIRAIQTGSQPACDGREGRRSVAVVEAIYKAARTGVRVLVA